MITAVATAALVLTVTPGCDVLAPREILPPEVHLADLVPERATLFEQQLRVDLRVRNPNDFELELDGLRYELAVAGEVLARGATDAPVTLPRLGEALVSTRTTTTSMAMVRQLANLSRGAEAAWRLEGEVFVKSGGPRELHFERAGVLGEPAPSPPTPPSPSSP